MSDESKQNPEDNRSPDDEREISLLEAFDRAVALLPANELARDALIALRAEIEAQEEMVGDARETIEKLEQIIKKVTSPANRIGTFLGTPNRDTAQIVVGGSGLLLQRRSARAASSRCAAARACWSTKPTSSSAISASTAAGRWPRSPKSSARTGCASARSTACNRSCSSAATCSRKEKLKAGDEVRLDPNYSVALEVLARPHSDEYYLDSVPELPWEKVGGQEEALQAIRDAIELPLLHADLFKRFQHTTPKGFLLYGPPGCGKTLIGKATAYNLTQQLSSRPARICASISCTSKGRKSSTCGSANRERMVREIFATAREKRREGFLPFLFIDEAESSSARAAPRATRTFSPRSCRCSARRWTASNRSHEVVIILACNRADLDRSRRSCAPAASTGKSRSRRPNKEGAREIYRIYLAPNLPYDPALAARTAATTADGHRCAHRQGHRRAIRAARRKPLPRSHPAQRATRRRSTAAT